MQGKSTMLRTFAITAALTAIAAIAFSAMDAIAPAPNGIQLPAPR